MKKHAFLILVLIIIAISTIAYKYPVEINKEYKGYLLYDKIISSENVVSISLSGKLIRNIFSYNSFSGTLSINGVDTHLETPLPGNADVRLTGVISKIKNNPLILQGTSQANGFTRIICVVHVSKDFNKILGHTDALREKYKSNELVFAAPAKNEKEARMILENMLFR